MIASIDELEPDARLAAQRFLDAAATAVARGLRDDVRTELAAHLCHRLTVTSTAAEVDELAASLAPERELGHRRLSDQWPAGLRVRGLLTRVAQTWWRPSDPRLLLPRAVGLGWDVNFGAIAVRLNLIEPDAEAVPFTSTPDPAFRTAAVLPVALAGAAALHYLVRGRNLPSRLASHWGPRDGRIAGCRRSAPPSPTSPSPPARRRWPRGAQAATVPDRREPARWLRPPRRASSVPA